MFLSPSPYLSLIVHMKVKIAPRPSLNPPPPSYGRPPPSSDGDASADAFRQNLEAAARRAIERMSGRSEEVDQIGNEGPLAVRVWLRRGYPKTKSRKSYWRHFSDGSHLLGQC